MPIALAMEAKYFQPLDAACAGSCMPLALLTTYILYHTRCDRTNKVDASCLLCSVNIAYASCACRRDHAALVARSFDDGEAGALQDI
jgi:hypothetical protein